MTRKTHSILNVSSVVTKGNIFEKYFLSTDRSVHMWCTRDVMNSWHSSAPELIRESIQTTPEPNITSLYTRIRRPHFVTTAGHFCTDSYTRATDVERAIWMSTRNVRILYVMIASNDCETTDTPVLSHRFLICADVITRRGGEGLNWKSIQI